MEPYKILFITELSNYTQSLGDALKQQGHVVYCLPSWEDGEIAAAAERIKPDLLITVGCREEGPSAMPVRLRELCDRLHMIHLYWATEDKIHYDRISLPVVQRLKPDLILTLHPDCIPMYQRHGFSAIHFNFALNPRLFPPKTDLSREIYDLSFVGTTHLEVRTYRYTSLKHLLFPLVKAGIRTEVWGRNWQRVRQQLQEEFGLGVPPEWDHEFLPFERTAEVYHQSRIMLGVQNAEDQVTQRTFEILGTGAFMIASRTPELMRLFREGEEIVLSSSPEETLELVEYYLRHPEERLRIGMKARAAVMREHTFDHRLTMLWPHVRKRMRMMKRSVI